MEGLDIILSLLVLAGLFWLHRRQLKRAYAAGWAAALAEQNRCTQHGLAALPAPDERR